MFTKILVALDHSELQETVFTQAVDLAKATQAELMLLHVLSPEEEGSPETPLMTSMVYYPNVDQVVLQAYQKRWESFEKESLEQLQKLAKTVEQLGIGVQYSQSAGSPGKTICDVAYSWGAELILMGRRGRTGISELLLGSVSNYVMHHAHCSVLIVHPPTPVNPQTPIATQTV